MRKDNEAKKQSLSVGEHLAEERDVWLMSPDEFVAKEAGRWVLIAETFADAMYRTGKRYQITKKDALEQHREYIETALTCDYPVAVASIDLYGLTLPKGYVRDGDFYIIPKSKTKKKAQPKTRR